MCYDYIFIEQASAAVVTRASQACELVELSKGLGDRRDKGTAVLVDETGNRSG
jgi:hypothetical protein